MTWHAITHRTRGRGLTLPTKSGCTSDIPRQALEFFQDLGPSPEIPQKEGVLGSEIAARNRKSLATFHRTLKSQCSTAFSCLGNRSISGVRDGHRNRKSQKSLRFRCAKFCALLRSFALFCGLLFALICALLHTHTFRVVADVLEKEFQTKSGSSDSCRLFLHFLGKNRSSRNVWENAWKTQTWRLNWRLIKGGNGEALFCALLRPFAFFCALLFALICALLHTHFGLSWRRSPRPSLGVQILAVFSFIQEDVNGEKLTVKKWWIFGADFSRFTQSFSRFIRDINGEKQKKNSLLMIFFTERHNVFWRRTNVQQLTCKIDLSKSFYCLFFSFVLLELKPFVYKWKVLGEKFWKSLKKCQKVWKIVKRFAL